MAAANVGGNGDNVQEQDGLPPVKCLSIKSKGLISNVLQNRQIRRLGIELGLHDIEVDYYMQCQNPVFHEMLDRVGDRESVQDLIYILREMGVPGDNRAYRSIGKTNRLCAHAIQKQNIC